MSRFVCGDNLDFVSFYVKEGYVKMDTKPTINYTRSDGHEATIPGGAYEMCIVDNNTLTIMYTTDNVGVIEITPMAALLSIEFKSKERSTNNETT